MEVVIGLISALAATFSAAFAAIELHRSRKIQDKIEKQNLKKLTIDAYNELQEKVLDYFVLFKENEAETFIEFKNEYPDIEKAYYDTKALIARCEHFAIGVNEGIYDYFLVKKLGGLHLVYLFKKVQPIIMYARAHSSDKNIYVEFEKMVNDFNKSYQVNIEFDQETVTDK